MGVCFVIEVWFGCICWSFYWRAEARLGVNQRHTESNHCLSTGQVSLLRVKNDSSHGASFSKGNIF